MEITAQYDASRRNLTSRTLKNGLSIYTNLNTNYIISVHVISVSYLHSFIECVFFQQDVNAENAIVMGNHDTIFGLPNLDTWSCT